MNEFTVKPALLIPRYPEIWTCPITGDVVDKSLVGNISTRQKFLELASTNAAFRLKELESCRKSILYWINQYVYTESFFTVDEFGVSRTRSNKQYPFITWPAQDELILEIERSINRGEPLLLEKSREVGATWCVLMVFLHQFLFCKRAVQFSMLSLKESDVDMVAGDVVGYPWGTISDPATLFGKLDYALRLLPRWMVPDIHRKRLHMVRPSTRSRIDGGASGTFALSSQRRDGLLMDEAAKTDNFKTIWEGTTDVARCRLAISTPVGMGTYFSELRGSGTIKVMELGWWQDPNKSYDLEIEDLPNNTFRYTSQWYRHECSMRTKTDIASNLDIKHLESGTTFFSTQNLKAYKTKNCLEPLLRLDIDFRPEVPDSQIPGIIATRDVSKIRVVSNPKGKWKLWIKPYDNPSFVPKEDEFGYRLSVGAYVVLGVDIGMGSGSSNSAISVVHKLTRNKIAEFADANTPPHQLAKIAIAAALWFGQTGRPLIVPEANGLAGFDFIRQLARVYRYTNIYQEHTTFNKHEKKAEPLGFHSSRPKKSVLLGNLARAYALGNFINPSAEAIDEAMQYVIFDTGYVGPASLQRESEDAKATHGDRVIADALAIWAGNEGEAWREERKQKEAIKDAVPQLNMNDKFPNGSMGWRWQNRAKLALNPTRAAKRMDDLKSGERFSFEELL